MAKSLKPRLVLLLMILAGFIYPTFSPVSSAASVDKLSASTLQLGVNLHPLQPPEAPTGQIPKQVNLLPNMGASIVRIDLKWAWIEPFGPGSNNWNPDPIDRLNTFLNAMSGNNIEIVATVDSTPCWASTLPKKDCNPNTINYPPANLQDYTNFLSELVKRYKTKIKYWEIWNEPNLPDFWATPDPEGYTALLKAAYSAVKAADPSAIVIGGALAPRNDPIDTLTYLDRMYSAGAKGYFDKLSYHPYTDGNTPTWYDKLWPMMSYSSSVPAIRQHMQNFNDSVPIWLTEIGWTTVPPSQCSDCWTPVLPKTEDEQAAYMVEAINIAKTWNYVETFIWYKLIDTISPFNPSKISYEHYFGLFRKDYTAKPAVVQFRMLATTPPVSNNPVYKNILSDFYNVWKQSDLAIANGQSNKSWLWGPDAFATKTEDYKEATGGKRQVQYFDKARMEINNPDGDKSSAYFVTNGLLPKELIGGYIQTGDSTNQPKAPAEVNVAGDPDGSITYAKLAGVVTLEQGKNTASDRTGQKVTASIDRTGNVSDGAALAGVTLAQFIPETGHNLPNVFVNYFKTLPQDWLFVMGYPISEPYQTEITLAGKSTQVLIQVFERRVLTYTSSNADPFKVEQGNVGRHYSQWRYGN